MRRESTWKRVCSAAFFATVTASAQTPDDIVGLSIACSNDHVFAWYSNRRVTIGTSENLDSRQGHEPPHTYSLPAGKTPADIVGIGISKQDHVYTWYLDQTVSVGTSSDLSSRQARTPYSMPPGKLPADIAGIDIACSSDKVFTWYRDGTVSIGSSTDLGRHQAPVGYALAPGKLPGDLVELGIAGTKDRVYAWYRDRQASAGTSSDLDSFRPLYRYAVVTLPCDIFANAPEKQGTDGGLVFGIGSRGPQCESSAGITVLLKQYRRFWFDRLLAQVSGSGTNFEATARFSCSGREGHQVYTQVKSGGREKESGRANIQFCF